MTPSGSKLIWEYMREILNQIFNLFWTAIAFTPIIWFWVLTGINLNFYFFLGAALITGILPEKILGLFMLSSSKKFYEKLGVKYIRMFVQNGDVVNRMRTMQELATVKGKIQAKQYLKTIAMYERFHWVCFTFFLLTGIYCLGEGFFKLGISLMIANLLYNVAPILLQQYNKIRVLKIIHIRPLQGRENSK